MKLIVIAAVAAVLVAASALVSAACHNATGSCTKQHFVCANEELVAHAKRCDGVEDCADGTDEYLCDASPKPLVEMSASERTAVTEVACVKCTCLKGTIQVTSTSAAAWWAMAKLAPRDRTMMTDAPLYQNKPCNVATVTSIRLNVYKKQNKGCRGWVCCFRQEQCTACSPSGTTATHCF
jgi:hypothetical protein